MKFKTLNILFILFLITGYVFAQNPSEPPSNREIFHSLGVQPDPENLVRYLKRGLPADSAGKMPPGANIPYTQTAINAMEMISRKQYKPAVPVLIDIARGNFPPGVASLVNIDCRSISRSQQEDKRETYHDVLRYNAVNSLGLIGDPRALPVLEEVFSESDREMFKIRAALGLACLDSGLRIPYLVKTIRDDNRGLAILAADALSLITGMDLDYDRYTPVSRREKTVEKVEEWWENNKEIFRPNGEEIIQRRLNPPVEPQIAPRSVRELLILASQYSDFSNRVDNLDARERLSAMGQSIIPELRPICLDENEDLNLRMEALRRFARLTKEDGMDVLKKARKDENPEISELADNLIEQIKEED